MTAVLTRPPHSRPHGRTQHLSTAIRERQAIARTDRRITRLIRDVPDGALRFWRLLTTR